METQFGVEGHLKDRKQSREQKDDPCKVDQQGGAAAPGVNCWKTLVVL